MGTLRGVPKISLTSSWADPKPADLKVKKKELRSRRAPQRLCSLVAYLPSYSGTSLGAAGGDDSEPPAGALGQAGRTPSLGSRSFEPLELLSAGKVSRIPSSLVKPRMASMLCKRDVLPPGLRSRWPASEKLPSAMAGAQPGRCMGRQERTLQTGARCRFPLPSPLLKCALLEREQQDGSDQSSTGLATSLGNRSGGGRALGQQSTRMSLRLEVWPGGNRSFGAKGLQCSSPGLLPLSRPSPFPLSLPLQRAGLFP